MNRRLALAASVGAAVAMVSGAVMVAALLSASPEKRDTPELASAAPVDTDSVTVTSLEPVVVYQDEYEYVVTVGEAGAPSGPAVQDDPGQTAAPASTGTASGAPVTTAPKVASTPVTAAPAPATTATTRPPGVPADWPADKAIPPVPANCRQPQLEDNGVWNCQR